MITYLVLRPGIRTIVNSEVRIEKCFRLSRNSNIESADYGRHRTRRLQHYFYLAYPFLSQLPRKSMTQSHLNDYQHHRRPSSQMKKSNRHEVLRIVAGG